MKSRWLIRFGLILALVFAQAVYAGHAMQHMGTANATDCSTCLHASSANDILPAASIYIISNDGGYIHFSKCHRTFLARKANYGPPSRAPPVS